MSLETLRHWVFNYATVLVTAALWFFVCRASGRVSRRIEAAGYAVLLALPFFLDSHIAPAGVVSAVHLAFMCVALGLMCAVLYFLARRPMRHDPSRRSLLASTAPALAAVPAVLGGAAFISARSAPRLDTVDVRVPGLPEDLDGLRIVQVSDFHYGAYFGRRDAERAIALANETKAHLAVVTGDLITFGDDDLAEITRIVSGLKSDAGILGCQGNHEKNAGVADLAGSLAARHGIRMLRQSAETLRFGNARLRVTGVDYLPLRQPLPPVAAGLREDGAFNLLLCHNPGNFPSARDMGFDLMLAGHTHGGQINLEIARANLNIALVYTPYVRGLYTEGGRSVYVSSGLGTVAAPVRLGAPPEVSLIRLCAA